MPPTDVRAQLPMAFKLLTCGRSPIAANIGEDCASVLLYLVDRPAIVNTTLPQLAIKFPNQLKVGLCLRIRRRILSRGHDSLASIISGQRKSQILVKPVKK